MTKVLSKENYPYSIEISDSTFSYTRKKPTLAIRYGNETTKVASFNNMESAEWFISILAEMVGASYE